MANTVRDSIPFVFVGVNEDLNEAAIRPALKQSLFTATAPNFLESESMCFVETGIS